MSCAIDPSKFHGIFYENSFKNEKILSRFLWNLTKIFHFSGSWSLWCQKSYSFERLSEYSSDSDSGQNSPPATAGGFTVDDDEIPAGFMLDDEKFNRFEPKYISIRI